MGSFGTSHWPQTSVLLFIPSLWLTLPSHAHKHHEQPTGWPANIIWAHIFLQVTIWGFLFPVGMVLGIRRSRWHIPLQSAGLALTFAGYLLGFYEGYVHEARYRIFNAGPHRTNAKILFAALGLQLVLGVYLKLRPRYAEERVRPWISRIHGAVGRAFPLLGWIQMLFGAVVSRNYCRGDVNLDQCLSFYTMGTGFLACAVIIAATVSVGQNWLRRSGKSPEWWDSCACSVAGLIVVLRRNGTGFSSLRMVLGCIWLVGGLLGIFLARNGRRTIVPSLIIVATGWSFASNDEELMIITRVYAMLGYTLIAAGVTRIVEVSLVFPDLSSPTVVTTKESSRVSFDRAFLHLPPFLLTSAGVLAISATKEELVLAHLIGMDHDTYILIMYSVAFLIYTLAVSLLWLYSAIGSSDARQEDDAEVISESISASRSKGYLLVPRDDGDRDHPTRLQL